MIRILNIIGSLTRTGAETFLMNIYRNVDREKFAFDFAIYNEPTPDTYYDEVINMGSKVFVLPNKKYGLRKNQIAIERIIQENGYDIVWRHGSNSVSGLDLFPAKKMGIKVRVMHSHNSRAFFMDTVLHYIFLRYASKAYTMRYACGIEAGKWMYGKQSFSTIYNGIDVDGFTYNDSISKKYRSELGIEGKKVLGHIGRFERVKNHMFLLDVMDKCIDKDPDTVLLLIGDGPLRGEIEKEVEKRGLKDKVIFLGIREDISSLLSAMDIFLLPSIYEGFPVVMIEAQANGLPCIVSDTISQETDITKTVQFLPINEDSKLWADSIEKSEGRLKVAREIMIEKGYDIKDIANRVMSEFCEQLQQK